MLIFYRDQSKSSKNFNYNHEGIIDSSINKNEIDKNITLNLVVFKDLLTIFSSILLSAIGYGIMTVLISVRLQQFVKDEILISISTLFQIGSGIIFSKYVPAITNKFGLTRTIFLSTLATAICCVLMFKFVNYGLWLIIVYLYGATIFICSINRGTAMVDLTPLQLRSIVISIGLTLIPVGSGLAPLILNLLNTRDTIWSFLLASFVFLLSYLPIHLLKKINSIVRENKKFVAWRYIKNSPKIFASCFTSSFIMSSVGVFSIIYGLQIGMPQNKAAILLTALFFGTIFNIPIGILCNYISIRFIILFSTISSIIVIYLLYNYRTEENIFLLFFLLYGFMSGIKLPANVLINEKYQANQRIIVMSTFSRVSITGTICGIINTGLSMKFLGTQGIWITYFIMLIIFLFFWIFNYIFKFINHSLSFKDLTFFKQKINETEKL
jgi:MFS family permease